MRVALSSGSRLRRTAVALGAVALVLTGCARATMGSSRSVVRVIPSGVSTAPFPRERSEFEMPLFRSEFAERRGPESGTVSISTRSDNVLLYSINIDNSTEDTYTQAQLVRLEPDTSIDVVATLFTGAVLRGRHVSVRGTASLIRSLPPEELLAHVREHPGTYQVRIQAERAQGALVGYLNGAR